ncbi:histidine--tRNA ligase [Canibacter sp. lx-72]|uniref:histidine--tRNA ligase n=1 Tax=Canibacter zhuwentaonis TaxID=2837491 RepID=UPI001BDC6F24|nr:histidine--tRNA ligase [Canibacter zhuwentaonis]MBT1018283.1 histidine--tRNA ligase [Canibacter zhuwentaonis]
MANKISAVRGMRDFLPVQKRKRERVLQIIREVYQKHAFTEIETPVVEDYDILHSGLGGDNEKLSFSILKRGISDKPYTTEKLKAAELCDLGLRFDLTVPLARYYASNQAALPQVFRAVQIGPVWRAERPQQGRYRQFVQADIDIIGEFSMLAELELITATAAALNRLGLRDCVIRINDRRVLLSLLKHCGFNADDFNRVLITIDKLDKIGFAGVIEELVANEFAASAVAKLEPFLSGVAALPAGIPLTVAAIAEVMPEEVQNDALAELAELGDSLVSILPNGVTAEFDPTLVRGMGYYTGTIFEISHPGSGSSVGGGGRYDGMIGRFLGEQVPAVGFSIGFERIIDLVELPEDSAQEQKIALIADKDCAAPQQLVKLKSELLALGKQPHIVWRKKNMKPVFAYLAAEGFAEFANVNSALAAAELNIKTFETV